MRIPIERQLELYDQHADAAYDALLVQMHERRDELIALGRERAFRSVGVHQYGDRTYFSDPATLRDEADAELADAIFYVHIPVAINAGDLPEVAT